MKILLVAATALEVAPIFNMLGIKDPLLNRFGVAGHCFSTGNLSCLVTGIGQLQCAIHLANELRNKEYDYVIQAGLAGSFTHSYPKCSVVTVKEEALADFGAESCDRYIDSVELGFLDADTAPFLGGFLRATPGRIFLECNLPKVRSVTVNRVLSDKRSVDWVFNNYHPDVVNMEGAALFYACSLSGVPCLQLRSISDMVGPRDKREWDIKGAVDALNNQLFEIISKYLSL